MLSSRFLFPDTYFSLSPLCPAHGDSMWRETRDQRSSSLAWTQQALG